MAFNEAQISAINHYKGPAMVLAGPGSGKTTVITHRIKNLIENYNISPSEILVITFTRMAGNEMKERFLKLTNNNYSAVTFGTFHAIYFTILKHAYNYSATNIIKQSQQFEFITSLIDNYELDINNKEEFTQKILAEISSVKGLKININEYNAINCPPKVFQDIFNKYNKMLTTKRLIDFDDMVLYCYELFDQRKDVLEAWQDKYKFILIDEFQDISDIQFDVVRQLASKYNNIFIVGDDDQSIYGFRGARPQLMMSFENIYKKATRIDMNTNYRSTANIVNASKSLIDVNKERLYKDIKTINPMGDKVIVNICENTEVESDYIVNQIKMLVSNEKNSIKYSDICILARTNSGTGLILQSLVTHKVPFSVKEKIVNIFEHWIAKDIIAYIKLSLGNRDRSNFLRIINKPLRYLNRLAFSCQPYDIASVKRYYADKLYMQEIVDNLMYDIKLMENMMPFAVVNYIRKGIGYDNYIKEYAREYHADYEELSRIVEEITQSVKGVTSWEKWFDYIEEYTRKLSENNNNNIMSADNKDAVNICTMHASKGLEYKAVFIIDVNENVIPYRRAVLELEIEEERRMFYVAMTRAKFKLYICAVKYRYDRKMEVSRFIEELDERFIEVVCE